METIVEAIQRLRTAGYVSDFFASSDGNLRCRSCGHSHDLQGIEIRETVRFEGDSNPDDEAILLALSCADGCLGQFSAAFGPATAAADVMVLQRLNQGCRWGTAHGRPPEVLPSELALRRARRRRADSRSRAQR